MTQYKREPLNSDEEVRLRANCRKPEEILCVILFLETGARLSELAELRPEQIDWQSRRLTIYGKGGGAGHNSKRRVIPLSDEAHACLARYSFLLQDGRNGDATWVTPRTIERVVARCANRAHIIRKCSPHVLRHTFAVNCLLKGIDIRTLMILLGHENIQTTMKYLNFAPELVCEQFTKKWVKDERTRYPWEPTKKGV